jgi:hypothetical protein
MVLKKHLVLTKLKIKMKITKTIFMLTFALLLLSFNSSKKKAILTEQNIEICQNNPFIGNWTFQNGNELFVLTLWSESNKIFGHYRMMALDNNGSYQFMVYNSNKEIGTSGQNWPYVVYSKFNEGSYISGNITDNSINNPNYKFIEGKFMMTLLDTCFGCNLTAGFKVEKEQGIRSEGEPDFNIPTDIVLTKLN